MARCIPDVIPAAQHHEEEAALLARFRTELPDEFIVIPCLEVPYLQAGRDSEADFVILHPRGRLVLEAKGGEIRCLKGYWDSFSGGQDGGGRFRPPVSPALPLPAATPGGIILPIKTADVRTQTAVPTA